MSLPDFVFDSMIVRDDAVPGHLAAAEFLFPGYPGKMRLECNANG